MQHGLFQYFEIQNTETGECYNPTAPFRSVPYAPDGVRKLVPNAISNHRRWYNKGISVVLYDRYMIGAFLKDSSWPLWNWTGKKVGQIKVHMVFVYTPEGRRITGTELQTYLRDSLLPTIDLAKLALS